MWSFVLRRLGEQVHTLRFGETVPGLARRSTVTELATALRIPERTMAAQVDAAQALVEHYPAALAGMRSGAITYRHAEVLMVRTLAAEVSGWTRILTDPISGEALDIGRTRYRVPGSMSRYLRQRDGTCRFPGCMRAAARCDVDHTVAWEDGGVTSVGNLAHLCRAHHRLKHLAGWDVEQATGGVLRWRSPVGRGYVTEPAMSVGRGCATGPAMWDASPPRPAGGPDGASGSVSLGPAAPLRRGSGDERRDGPPIARVPLPQPA